MACDWKRVLLFCRWSTPFPNCKWIGSKPKNDLNFMASFTPFFPRRALHSYIVFTRSQDCQLSTLNTKPHNEVEMICGREVVCFERYFISPRKKFSEKWIYSLMVNMLVVVYNYMRILKLNCDTVKWWMPLIIKQSLNNLELSCCRRVQFQSGMNPSANSFVVVVSRERKSVPKFRYKTSAAYALKSNSYDVDITHWLIHHFFRVVFVFNKKKIN